MVSEVGLGRTNPIPLGMRGDKCHGKRLPCMEKKTQKYIHALPTRTQPQLFGVFLGFLTAQLTPDELQAHKKLLQQLMELSACLFMEPGVFAVKHLSPREFTAPKLFGAFQGLGSPLRS